MPAKKIVASKTGPGSDEDFTFPSSLGEITVPSLSKAKTPNAWQMMEIEAIENTRVKNARESLLFLTLAIGDDPKTVAIVKQFDMVEMGEFLEAWGKHSGVSLGEFKAS